MLLKIKKNWSIGVVAIFLIVSAIYILIRQGNIYIQVHDFLDNHIQVYKLLKDNNMFFTFSGNIPIIGGMDRNCGYSIFQLYTWLYIIFPVPVAIIVSWYLKIIISIISWNVLFKSIYEKCDINIPTIAGFMYGILPTYPPADFDFASLPLVVALLVMLYKEPKKKYFVLLILYPFLSRLYNFGTFICGYLLLFFLIDWVIAKKPKVRLLGGVVCLSIGYLIAEWQMFYYLMIQEGGTIRNSFDRDNASFVDSISKILEYFIKGYYHCGSLHTYVVLPICFIYSIYLSYRYIKNGKVRGIFKDKFVWIIAFIALNCIIAGFNEDVNLRNILNRVIPFLAGFDFSRTIWMNPFLWYFSFAIILKRIDKMAVNVVLSFVAIGVIMIVPNVYNNISLNISRVVYEIINDDKPDNLTYREFYSVNLFNEIKEDIGYNGEWSIAFGMHPAVIEYNDISTLDGYNSLYSAKYKEEFRELIAPDLAIDEQHQKYFDGWGARAYIFSDEIDYQPDRGFSESANMRINPEVFAKMGGKYVFSRVEILNANDLKLNLEGVYTHPDSPYKIWVYSN